MRSSLITYFIFIAALTSPLLSAPKKLSKEKLTPIDALVSEQIEKGSFPGAAVCIGQGDDILYLKSFGHEVIQPFKEAVDDDTVFDLASVSKPVATATSIMILRDRNKLSLDDLVAKYLPAFAAAGKEEVKIKHLLTHTSGLPAYTSANPLKEKNGCPCPEKVIEKICSLKAQNAPGEKFRYSCLGYITLARIVEIVSGLKIDVFARENIFQPLGMIDTMYNPPADLTERIAATTIEDDKLIRGTVHDPLARLMAGISGNAGVFSTARDLSIYCRMLLNDGRWNGKTILTPESVKLLTNLQSQGRAYGFDVSSGYAWIKGDHAPETAFCHSGYTGTSIVCDPVNKVFVIILTNRAHPNDKGASKPIRTGIANLVFQALE